MSDDDRQALSAVHVSVCKVPYLTTPALKVARLGVRASQASRAPNFFPFRRLVLRLGNLRTRAIHRDRNDCSSSAGNNVKMAAFVKAVNAKIRANPVLNYVCSTRELLLFC